MIISHKNEALKNKKSGCGECYRKVCVYSLREDVVWESESVSSFGGRSHSRSPICRKNDAKEEVVVENEGWQKQKTDRKKAAAKLKRERE